MRAESRLTHWLLGVALGALAGGFMLEAGVLALLLIVPVLVWGSRETTRPLGLAGFVVGIGGGMAGLLAFADHRCAADPSCWMPDQTPCFLVALVLVAGGALLTLLGQRGRAASAG